MHFFSRHNKPASEASAVPTARRSNPFARKLLVYTGVAAFSLCTIFMQPSPAMQLAPKQQEKPAPVNFQFNGWHAKLTLTFPNKNTSYEIKSSIFTVEEFTVTPDSDLAPQTFTGLAVPPKTASLHVSQLEAINSDSSKLTYSFDTTFAANDYRFTCGNTAVYVEDSAFKSQAISAAAILDEINRHPKMKNKASLYVPFSPDTVNTISPWMGFTVTSDVSNDHGAEFLCNVNKVSVPTAWFVSGLGPAFVSHETSHALFWQAVGKALQDSLWRIFDKRAVVLESAWRIFDKRQEMTDSAWRGPDSRPGVKYLELACKDTFFALFNEGSYGHAQTHPHDNPDELSASGATDLKCYPGEFFGRLEALRKADPELAEDAKSVAWLIAVAYLPLRPFEPFVYDKLGIPKHMTGPPKALR